MSAERPPRLMMVTPAFPPAVGGIELLCARLAEQLAPFDLTVVAPAARGALPDTMPPAHRPPGAALLLRGPARTAALNAYAAAVARRVRPDVVLNMHIATAPAVWTMRVPYVQYVYASELPPWAGLARRALRRASRVIAISSHSRELALLHGADPARTVIIPPGVDQPLADPADGERVEGRVLAVARLDEPCKGHDTLIRAMPLVRSVVPHAHARIVGEGRLRPSLERLAAGCGAQDLVSFLGAATDARRDAELRAASVFCLPVRVPPDGAGEGFGIAFLEAGAFGLPVVAGRAAGAVDAVLDGETGYLVDAGGDHVALADALIGLLGDPELRLAMARSGRERSRSFSWRRMGAAVAQQCSEVAGERR